MVTVEDPKAGFELDSHTPEQGGSATFRIKSVGSKPISITDLITDLQIAVIRWQFESARRVNEVDGVV
jgi:hypothetical protein